MKAYLVMSDGTVYRGEGIGADTEKIFEVVFNTSMTGYVELLTDASYKGQGVVMTYPLIGNCGVCLEDQAADKPLADALIVRELSRTASNFRNEMLLEEYLKQHGIPGIAGIDTRALTKRLRENGTMNGMITTREPEVDEALLTRIKAYRAQRLVGEVSVKEAYTLDGSGQKAAVLDLGCAGGLAKYFNAQDIAVRVFPYNTKSEEILAFNPEGIVISDGPGDPKDCTETISELSKLYEKDIPMFAVGLGHQLLALATGADTYKLTSGHRGANHPVKDLSTGRVYITAQGHGYAVKAESVKPEIAEVSHVNVNDGTVEGLRYKNKKIFTVQYQPGAASGPKENRYLLEEFIEMMGGSRA